MNTLISDAKEEEILVIQWIDDTKVGENKPKGEGEFNTKEGKKVLTQNCKMSWNQNFGAHLCFLYHELIHTSWNQM